MSRKPFTLQVGALDVLPTVRLLAEEASKNTGDELDENWLSWYMNEVVAQGISIGSGQISPTESASARAFTALLRVKRAGLVALHKVIEYRRHYVYDEEALCQTLCEVLKRQPELRYALTQLLTCTNTGEKGPFSPKQTWLPIRCHGQERKERWTSDFARQLARTCAGKTEANLNDEDRSVLALVGLIRVLPADVNSAAHALRMRGLTGETALRLAISQMVIATLRSNRRFAEGIEWAQPENEAAQGEQG